MHSRHAFGLDHLPGRAFALTLICALVVFLPSVGSASVIPTAIKVGDGRVVRPILIEETGAWTVVCHETWISVSASEGFGQRVVDVIVEKNSTGLDRSGSITIGGVDIAVTQKAEGSGLRELWVMGSGQSGARGDGTNPFRAVPAPLMDDVSLAAAGREHSLLLKTDGTLWAAGHNDFGQLGDGTTTDRTIPVLVATEVSALAAGAWHSLFVKTDGTLWAMGDNRGAKLGDGTTSNRSTPVQVASDVATVAAGVGHSLFVKTDGTLWGMGFNFHGELGDGTGTQRSTPVQVATGVTTVSAGERHSLFIKADGTLWAMGMNEDGEMGEIDSTFTPVQVAGDVAAVAAGNRFSLFSKTDGTLWAMGSNIAGQLGDGTTTGRRAPVQVASNVTAFAAGVVHSLFVKSDGTLWAMGRNTSGELGDGSTAASLTPVQVATDVASVTAGEEHSLFVKADGTLWAMGGDLFGQLGDGSHRSRNAPVQIASDVAAVAAGTGHSLFLMTDGTLWAMGDNPYGQLGDGSDIVRTLPVQVASDVAGISAGGLHSLFVKTDGTLWAMGNNNVGQLGDGTKIDRHTPVQVASDVATASAGGAHSVFVKTDGTLWAMGHNYYGQLGDGTTVDRSTPVQVASGVEAVATGSMHSFFVTTDGTLWAMGWNASGQLGDGTLTNRSIPVQIASDVAFVAEAMGPHSMFVKSDGTLWAMGYNIPWLTAAEGGTQSVPTLIATEVSTASAGFGHRLFKKADGTLWGIGGNWDGQLGDGTTIHRVASVPVASGVISVAAGSAHSLFIASGEIGVPPQLTANPVTETVVLGGSTTLSANVVGSGPLTYQWKLNGTDIAGATDASLSLSNIHEGQGGIYSVVASNYLGSATSAPAAIAIDPTPRVINVSARALAGSGDETLILGFHISGIGEKTVLIRGIGPQLAVHNVPSVVTNPRIALYRGDAVIDGNDDWDSSLAADFAATGAFALESGSRDSAFKATLPPGSYTVHLVNDGLIAEALIEVYDLSRDLDSRITNVSCRVKLPERGKPILGFGLVSGPMPVLVRNVGPELVTYGIPVEEVLLDPHLRVYSGSTEVAANDDWDTATGDFFGPAGAFPLDPGSKDAAIRVPLNPGGATVHATGVNGSSGVAIIELYESN